MFKSCIFILCSSFLFCHFSDAKIDPFPVTHILMVRHGETYRNAAGKEIQGWIDDSAAQLNAKGQAQAEDLGRLLVDRYQDEISIIYSSPLTRCIETSEKIAQFFKGIQIIKDPRLMEICHGQHDMMPFKERNAFCLQRYAELETQFKHQCPNEKLDRFFKWKINPLVERAIPMERIENPLPGDLETVFELFKRASSAIEEIAKRHPGQTLLISSHAALIKTLADEAEYREKGDERPLPVYYESTHPARSIPNRIPNNCSVYHFIYDAGKLTFIGIED